MVSSLRTRTPPARDRTHGQFGVRGDTKLSDDEHVERCVQGARDLIGNGDAAAWQRQDYNFVPASEMLELEGQFAAGAAPVHEGKRHWVLPGAGACLARPPPT
jgi:hypothetical protein